MKWHCPLSSSPLLSRDQNTAIPRMQQLKPFHEITETQRSFMDSGPCSGFLSPESSINDLLVSFIRPVASLIDFLSAFFLLKTVFTCLLYQRTNSLDYCWSSDYLVYIKKPGIGPSKTFRVLMQEHLRSIPVPCATETEHPCPKEAGGFVISVQMDVEDHHPQKPSCLLWKDREEDDPLVTCIWYGLIESSPKLLVCVLKLGRYVTAEQAALDSL